MTWHSDMIVIQLYRLMRERGCEKGEARLTLGIKIAKFLFSRGKHMTLTII